MGLLNWILGTSKHAASNNPSVAPSSSSPSSHATPPPLPAPPAPPRPPQERIIDEFTPLYEAYLASRGGHEAAQAYFSAFLRLPTVYSSPQVPPGSTIDQMFTRGEFYGPVCSREDGKLLMLLFTSEARAIATAFRNGWTTGDGRAAVVLPFAMPDAISNLMRSGQIDGVVINKNFGEYGVTIPTAGLACQYEYMFDRLPPFGMNQFLRNEAERPSFTGQARVARRLILDCPSLYLVANWQDPMTPLSFIVGADRALLCLFTDHANVQAGAHLVARQDESGSISAISTNPSDLLRYADNLEQHSRGIIREFVINVGTAAATVSFDTWREAVRQTRM